jgi:hypothetical protein
MAKWVEESKSLIPSLPQRFGIFIDMRNLATLPQESKIEMEKGQIAYKQAGMQRSVVILENSIIAMQFKKIAKETGIDQWERYIDASSNPNWEDAGLNWIVSSKEPE